MGFHYRSSQCGLAMASFLRSASSDLCLGDPIDVLSQHDKLGYRWVVSIEFHIVCMIPQRVPFRVGPGVRGS